MIDRPSQDFLLRLDNTAVIKLLTGCAAALADRGIFSSHDADDLRIALGGLQNESEPRPLLRALHEQQNEFLTMLFARYGHLGFCQNIFRYTVDLALKESSHALSELGETILSKSKIVFNRPFYIYLSGQCERRTLFSSVLVELAEAVDHTCRTLDQASEILSVLFPSSLSNSSSEDKLIDERVRQEVGFASVAHDALGFCREEAARALIVAAFTGLSSAIKDFAEQLKFNKFRDDTSATLLLCESMQADVQLLGSFAFPKTTDLSAWEVRRKIFVGSIRNLNHHTRQLAQQFQNTLTKLSNIQGATQAAVPEDVIRGMSTAMIKDGTAPLKAVSAACALVRYCEMHQVTADRILPAELAKIDPCLSTASLEILKSGENRPTDADLKQQNLERQQSLLQRFHAKLTQAGVLVISFFMVLGGCGIKMAPKSELIDYRPPVRYHSQMPMPEHIRRAKANEAKVSKSALKPNESVDEGKDEQDN